MVANEPEEVPLRRIEDGRQHRQTASFATSRFHDDETYDDPSWPSLTRNSAADNDINEGQDNMVISARPLAFNLPHLIRGKTLRSASTAHSSSLAFSTTPSTSSSSPPLSNFSPKACPQASLALPTSSLR